MTQLVNEIGELSLTWPEEPKADTIIEAGHPAVLLGEQILNGVLNGNDPTELGDWREAIDEIDLLLAGVVAARVAATEKVGRLKVEQGISAVDTERERTVIGRASLAAEVIGAGVRPEVTALMSALIRAAHSQYNVARRAVST
ncbi:MAG TPA: chorismate mutase [Candidatus Saccharimonadales bacterium]|nr:chorismate mutase [Candidatus Saccharimonadales bacterium]